METSKANGPCVVRIQADSAEPSTAGEWDDLVEIPYRSTTGAVGLTTITMGAGEEQVRLGAPGSYRVRVAHRALSVSGELPGDEDELEPSDLWQLDFWPVDVVEAPRWLRRMTAPVGQLNPGWSSLLPYDVNDVADMVRWNGGVDGMSVDELRQWDSNTRGAGGGSTIRRSCPTHDRAGRLSARSPRRSGWLCPLRDARCFR
ncbi:hypothetical protein [Kribbella sp. NPDC023855]|uniref:hypothetical protein n=1 Tax=Kribbella sp. NPDC023855 TaxID=3154698 RepID=UPI0033DDCDCD